MYPKVIIEYCAKCKWHNRAVWYLQEILQTFSDPEKNLVAEVALRPSYDSPGTFVVRVATEEGQSKIVYCRRMKKSTRPQTESYHYDGFPDSKLLKNLIRNELFPEHGLGHSDGQANILADCLPCREIE